MEMRRKDRAVTDPDLIEEIIARCHCCRLAFCDGDAPYIVPLSFGYVRGEAGYTFYFHSAKEGRKIDLIRANGRAGFELDGHYKLNEGDAACGYSARFQSVIGVGRVSFVEERAAKEAALRAMMNHTAGPGNWTFAEKMLEAVCVFKLETESLSCKEHL